MRLFIAIELPKKRSFSPHITMARVKQPGTGDIACFLNQNIRDKFTRIKVSQFVLFQSRLTQQGAIHKPVRLFPANEAES